MVWIRMSVLKGNGLLVKNTNKGGIALLEGGLFSLGGAHLNDGIK